ncbi:MAG TPA: contractile injection system tape measure protein, partial [Bacteroidia bacterium]|nr:contractile injection system tape measure protein [Bacteroidia bacterium]
MQHIIRRQVLQLEISKELDPFQIQHSARRQYWEKIVKVLENFFNEISSDDEVVRIDRLEINLGVFSEKDFENIDWSEQLISKIMEQLRKSTGAKSVLQKSSRISELENIFSQWIFYLKNGWLPWNTIRADNAWYDKILESLAVNYQCAEQFRTLISTDPKVVNRLIYQHKVFFLVKIVALLTSENQKDLITAIDEIFIVLKFLERKNGKKYIDDKENFEKECWKQVLQIAAVKERNSIPAIISKKLLTANFSRDQIFQCSASKFLQRKLKIILPVLDKLAAGQAKESLKTSEGKMIVAGKKEIKTNTSGREEINAKTPGREEIKRKNWD